MVSREREKMMNGFQYDALRKQAERLAELNIEEWAGKQERDFNTYPGDTSTTPQRKRLSRRAFVLIQLTILLLIIVGMIFLYHLIH